MQGASRLAVLAAAGRVQQEQGASWLAELAAARRMLCMQVDQWLPILRSGAPTSPSWQHACPGGGPSPQRESYAAGTGDAVDLKVFCL